MMQRVNHITLTRKHWGFLLLALLGTEIKADSVMDSDPMFSVTQRWNLD